ncbi:1-(5-phosphoribosyl)-5-[(5-phosphoribosylamino)methylideneamino]imidazole-4-carboxamide isomerase [Ammoniphilus oxalaticus]|uniref:1-(5-phosphoribosyl)-5-[(5-phosphoribosylamino)methylideneamino] imidazole-4-carboxamide isomerase n=1 Tax=Ammoniphilus oxalaticus TaxID=66863 RepID=A0A419SEP5_9BACL|nr:1-(5-phosphoribosyl)-5-[(5-phosphoribosylamino)methylideneamino]imidazole-4-carboxamide isomerase [Ammoniphilus oxalaticus]RKD21806.1 1-(5-phosphoribosyl)-5-[(5-phosphoribosylamino)methylideneamino]imidazole-4-carboxamide isomerase [Ammoniphilus oxalaticus]
MSEFIIYPAIDIRGGKCVRLFQGDYDQETVYGDSPVDMAKQWEQQGAAWIHVVDLDGAKAGAPVNDEAILEMARTVNVPIQVGGGIRTMEHARKYLDGGVARVILGTSAIQDRPFAEEALATFGGSKIVIGIDAREGYVATHGWLETSEVKADTLARELAKKGAEVFIYTDIARDGTLEGPNIKGNLELAREANVTVIASGGVSKMEDLKQLAPHAADGISGVIVGKALYMDRFTLADALKEVEVN